MPKTQKTTVIDKNIQNNKKPTQKAKTNQKAKMPIKTNKGQNCKWQNEKKTTNGKPNTPPTLKITYLYETRTQK